MFLSLLRLHTDNDFSAILIEMKSSKWITLTNPSRHHDLHLRSDTFSEYRDQVKAQHTIIKAESSNVSLSIRRNTNLEETPYRKKRIDAKVEEGEKIPKNHKIQCLRMHCYEIQKNLPKDPKNSEKILRKRKTLASIFP